MQSRRLFAVAVLVVVACVDGGRSSGPSFAISDAVNGDAERNPYFYWLPPLVPAPRPNGEFNPFAAPIVTVCRLQGAECTFVVAEFSTTGGTGSEVIRVNPTDGLYIVNWRTDLSHLDPAFGYRIIVSLNGNQLGFADVVVGLTGKDVKAVDRDEAIPLVDGRTLPIKFRIEAGAACVGNEAGCTETIVDPTVQEIVRVVSGGQALAFADFPAGWAQGPQLVRIERIPDGDFGPGQGPLGTEFPQYPLFFHYFTSVQDSFNLPVRIGVCNVESSSEDPYHPRHRGTSALAMGEAGKFRVLPWASTIDVLGHCAGATRQASSGTGALPGVFGALAAQVGRTVLQLVFPRTLHASALVVDGGMGGSTSEFSPAGTVDTGTAGLAVPGPLELTSAMLSSATLTIGQSVSATITVLNSTLTTASDVELRASFEQGVASRAGGLASVACGAVGGSVPPGTCTITFTVSPSNITEGSGMLVSGVASARFALLRSGAIVDEVTVPVTLTSSDALQGF